MASEYAVREYQKEDWPMISDWLLAHGSSRVSQSLLPPVGVVVEHGEAPVAALWCHLSVNIGVAFLEAPVTAPGLGIRGASEALSFGLCAVEDICRTHDYGLLVAVTLPGIARFLERRHGFQSDGQRIQMVKLLK